MRDTPDGGAERDLYAKAVIDAGGGEKIGVIPFPLEFLRSGEPSRVANLIGSEARVGAADPNIIGEFVGVALNQDGIETGKGGDRTPWRVGLHGEQNGAVRANGFGEGFEEHGPD